MEIVEEWLSDHVGLEVVIGKTIPERKKISFLTLEARCTQKINLTPKSFVNQDLDLLEMQQELIAAQELLGGIKHIGTNLPPECNKKSKTMKLKQKIAKANSVGTDKK